MAPEYLPDISIGYLPNISRISPSEAESQRMPAFGDHVSRAPRRHAPFSDVHHPFALLQGEGGAPAGHFARWSACPLLADRLVALALADGRAAVGVRV